jgi:acyl-ACP--UDP-N-acetylglucosamine O-acyltransferase
MLRSVTVLDRIECNYYGRGKDRKELPDLPGAVIAAIPQDLKFQGEYSQVIIGDKHTIREFVTINRGTVDREKTVIGRNCLIMAYCHFAHDCIVGNNCIMSNNTQVAGHVTIGDWSIWVDDGGSPVCSHRPAFIS